MWERLGCERDAAVIALVMWDWIDELKQPILHAQDLPHMLRYITDPLEGLNQLDKVHRRTAKCRQFIFQGAFALTVALCQVILNYTSFLLVVESADRDNDQWKLCNLGLSHVGLIPLSVPRPPPGLPNQRQKSIILQFLFFMNQFHNLIVVEATK